MVGFCSGTIAGLVAATPASGFLPPWASVVLGVVTGAVCNYSTKNNMLTERTVKYLIGIDDALDLFAEHAIGGILGLLANGLFADNEVIALDGINTAVPGGWIRHNYKQLYIQFAYVCAACGYVFVMTAILAKLVDICPGLGLRASEQGEIVGMDDDQIGEFVQDFVEVRRDFDSWTPPAADSKAGQLYQRNGHDIAAGDRHGVPDHSARDEARMGYVNESGSDQANEKAQKTN
ncbi:hypothetical protein FRC07_004457 [Ceratobasidium sp. 392]|nr:hypothetical protein FRC07_004457 [Ceratobasidium sp. 392]